MAINTTPLKDRIYVFRQTAEPDSVSPSSLGLLLLEIVKLLDGIPSSGGEGGGGGSTGSTPSIPMEEIVTIAEEVFGNL